jgi:hypothetical protein
MHFELGKRDHLIIFLIILIFIVGLLEHFHKDLQETFNIIKFFLLLFFLFLFNKFIQLVTLYILRFFE